MPVIVVRPSSKRDKARNKRALDPNRHAYKDLLEKSGTLIDTDARNVYTETSRPQSRQASEDEAAAVAAAIGYRPLEGSPLAQSQTIPVNLDAAFADQDLKSPGIVMKSPELQNLESPEISDSSSSEDEDEDEDEGGVPTNAPAVGVGLGTDVEAAAEAERNDKATEKPPTPVHDIKEAEHNVAESEPKDEVALKTEEPHTTAAATQD